MLENRSVPPDTILPHVMYQDLPAAISWLTGSFGFSEHYRYGDPPSGAQVHLGNAWIMLKQARPGSQNPIKLGFGTQSLTVFVDDVDAHFQRTKSAGATIVEDLNVTVYGERQYGVTDLEGHHWLFSQHTQDLNPSDWGASVAHSASRVSLLRRPRFCYLEIPALDVHQSAAFYEKVFSWNIRHRDLERPSFDDATGNMSGAWITGRDPACEPRLLPFIWVDNISATLSLAASHGAKIVSSPQLDPVDSIFSIATFLDPGGNLIGLYQETPRP